MPRVEGILLGLGDRVLGNGFFFKARSSYGSLPPARLLLPASKGETEIFSRSDRIVIVGTGIAALTFLEGLKAKGYTNVALVCRDTEFGGKCVNLGCMPSEYFSLTKGLAASDRPGAISAFVNRLRGFTRQRFLDSGAELIPGEVREVSGKRLLLEDGQELSFDRLVLATGNRIEAVPGISESITLKEYWNLPPSSRLAIVSDHQPGALSLAAMAKELGHEVSVLFRGELALAHLPSFQYFLREVERAGVNVYRRAKLKERKPLELEVHSAQGSGKFHFDQILNFSSARPNLPRIDGKQISVFDFEFGTGQVRGRSDVYVVGDAAGFLSAAEAEVQATQILRVCTEGGRASEGALRALPLRIHSRESIALAGRPETLFAKGWVPVDFSRLGWTAAHGGGGRLWYLPGKEAGKVDAIHICHRDAGELISAAALLLDLPVSDIRWESFSVHPSPYEIFRLVAMEFRLRGRPARNVAVDDVVPRVQLQLPPMEDLCNPEISPGEFSRKEIRNGLLSQNPLLYFALAAATKHLFSVQDDLELPPLGSTSLHHHRFGTISYLAENGSPVVLVSAGGRGVTVFLGEPMRGMERLI